MADETHVISGINWRATFPFTQIFRSFRIAIHPSKLILALALLILFYLGGQILDGLWPAKYSFPPGKGTGIFSYLLSMQTDHAESAFRSVLRLDVVGAIGHVGGFFVEGPYWLFRQHWFFGTLLTAWFLVLWSVFGGAISRIAAVHVARDEKISVREALKFSISKILSFIFAPVIPLLIIAVVGLVVSFGALLNNIPWIGPIVMGALFFLALIAGLIMTLVLIGLLGGFNLMYPTIATEGSDSFDAISRSFSYLYARPWRLAWYSLVALGYGAVTYFFIKFFIGLTLFLTHSFADLGSFANAKPGVELWTSMWPAPSIDPISGQLTYKPVYSDLNGGERIGAFILAFWNYLVVGLLGAFAISFYFSANTIIYYLMRQEVDATELDDVYVEQADEDFAETPTAPASAPSLAASTTTASTDTPPAAVAPATDPTPPPAENPNPPSA